jgi:lipopolysaccharide export system permease protein
MFPTTLQRAIFRELLLVFITALFVCVALLIVADMFDDRWKNCVGAASVVFVIQWLVLAMLPEAVPTALLFAACQVYGRMRRDMEWQAVQAGGIHFFHVILPALLLGVAFSLGIVALSYTALPSAEFLARKAVIQQGEALIYAKLRSSGMVKIEPYTIYARRVEGRELVDPIVKREASDGKTDLVMQAATGELTIDTECGMLHLDSAAVLEPQVRGSVQRFTWEIPLPNCFGVYFPQTAREMTLSEVLTRRDELRERESTLAEDPTLDAMQVSEKRRALRGEIRWLDVELQKRPAVAVGCLCFALVGCAAGVYAGFGDILSAFVACFLPICASHHILLVCGIQWAAKGGWPPEITVWLADAIVGGAGVVMLWRATRR